VKQENLLAAIRVAMEGPAMQETVTRHSRQTDDCLSLPAFVLALRRGFSKEELAHVGDCAFCQKMVAMEWRLDCPSLVTLARIRNGTLPHRYAPQEHLEECESCRERLESPLVRALAAAGSALAVDTILPASVMGYAGKDEIRLPLLAQDKQEGLTIALQERDGRLMGLLLTDDPTRAGQRLRIDLFDEKGQSVKSAELVLIKDDYGCAASLDFGSFRDCVRQLGSECALTATSLEQ